jgi:enoyl-CoA hydratase/carnithine racemase
MTETVLHVRDGAVATISLNQPESRNAISGTAVIDRLVELVGQADRDIETRVVILTGVGNTFSSGGDLNQMKVGGGLNDAKPVTTRPPQLSIGYPAPAASV